MESKVIYTLETNIAKIEIYDNLSCQIAKANGQKSGGHLHFRGHELYCIIVDDFALFKSSSIGEPGKKMQDLQKNVEAKTDTPRTKFNKLCQATKKAGFHYRFVNEEEFEDGIGAAPGHNWIKNPSESGLPYVTWYTESQVKEEVGI